MPRKILIAFVISTLVVPACGLGGTNAGGSDIVGNGLATPTPTHAAGGGYTLPPGAVNLDLELTYLLVATAGTDDPVTFTTTIPITPSFSSANLTGAGVGEILEDVPFTIGPVTTHNVADWIIGVTATLDPAGGEEPLALEFIFTGQGYASVQEVQIGAHMDSGGVTYQHGLTLPMEDGASKSFDIEGWKDIQEWMVVLHIG